MTLHSRQHRPASATNHLKGAHRRVSQIARTGFGVRKLAGQTVATFETQTEATTRSSNAQRHGRVAVNAIALSKHHSCAGNRCQVWPSMDLRKLAATIAASAVLETPGRFAPPGGVKCIKLIILGVYAKLV
jgi:hypothetical protein